MRDRRCVTISSLDVMSSRHRLARVALAGLLAASLAGGAGWARAQDESSYAPELSITLLRPGSAGEEETLKLSELRGTVVVLNFWAALCPPCRTEMPELESFQREVGNSVLVLGLDVGEHTGLGSRADALRLIDELGITYPVGAADNSGVLAAFGVVAMPSTVFINAEGEIFERWHGPLNRQMLVTIVREMTPE